MLIALTLVAALQETPPSITYPNRRQSEEWIDIGGTSVAVDKGITWRGVTAYLSLTGQLVAVDEKSAKTLWSSQVGSFWNAMTFKEVRIGEAPAVWAVELSPGPRAAEGRELRQYHDLNTGRAIDVPDPTLPGTPLEIRQAGFDAGDAAPRKPLRIARAEDWKPWAARLGAPLEIDFATEIAVVIGPGLECVGAFENDSRILFRLTPVGMRQTCGDMPPEPEPPLPATVLVLPRRDAKALVFERNVQSYLHGPAIWKEFLLIEAK